MAKNNHDQTQPTMSADASTPADRLRAAADELTRPRRSSVYLEFYDPKAKRRVRRRVAGSRQSLIDGLQTDVHRDDDTAPKLAGGGASGGFESRPPGKYAPRELLDHLERDLGYWKDWLGFEGYRGAAASVLAIASTADRLEAVVLAEVTRELEQWGARLRRYGGVERIYRPRATCPQCARMGTLTVWIDEDGRRPERGECSSCRATWDTSTVGLLVEHVRGERRLADTKVDLIKRQGKVAA